VRWRAEDEQGEGVVQLMGGRRTSGETRDQGNSAARHADIHTCEDTKTACRIIICRERERKRERERERCRRCRRCSLPPKVSIGKYGEYTAHVFYTIS
jgi:hypothetical protein